MKTLNELRLQAENMLFSKMQDPCSPLADLASRLLFRAGWSAAVKELTRWRGHPLIGRYENILREISMTGRFTLHKNLLNYMAGY